MISSISYISIHSTWDNQIICEAHLQLGQGHIKGQNLHLYLTDGATGTSFEKFGQGSLQSLVLPHRLSIGHKVSSICLVPNTEFGSNSLELA